VNSADLSIIISPSQGRPGAEVKVTVSGLILVPESELPPDPLPIDYGPVYMGKLDSEDKMVEKYNMITVWDDEKNLLVDWVVVDRSSGTIERMYKVPTQMYAVERWIFVGLKLRRCLGLR
jgi:hypothetical protein